MTTYPDARILVVDDEPANLLLVRRALEHAGFRFIHTTTDPDQAVPLFLEHQPDLVLLDLVMPRKDGYAVLADLRAHMPDVPCPVLILTADPAAFWTCWALGARDFMVKPLEVPVLLHRVAILLELRALRLALPDAR